MPNPTLHNSTSLYELVQPTVIEPLPGLEGVWLANETIQSIGSFKIRGALHALQQARRGNPDALEQGVYCASAGNAAQGVALAATYLGATAHIFLPENVPPNKVEAVEALGGNVTRVTGSVDDALYEALQACHEKGGYFVHPFDDRSVIEGQSSLGYEIAAADEFDTVFVPVGGGGLLAGICQALDALPLKTKVVGVQLEGCDSFAQSIQAGHPVELAAVNGLADGTAVKRAGTLTLAAVLASTHFEKIITVSNQELGCALSELDILTDIQAETAAGLSFAGLRCYLQDPAEADKKHLAVITGRHRDPTRFAQLFAS